MANTLLEVRDLVTTFATPRGELTAVDHVSFSLREGEVLGIVGESGSGKSATALSLMRLIAPPGRISGGSVLLEGEDLLRKSEREMRAVRGGRVSMVFQEVMTSLDPAYRIGEQVTDVLRLHLGLNRKDAHARAIEVLGQVHMPSPEETARRFPHELSGGMRQRAMIAIGLACRPKLLIADEITTALDVTVQAQILELLQEIRREMHLAMIFISHDLPLVSRVCDRIAVMYAGRMVEYAGREELFQATLHPYTAGLLQAIPRKGSGALRPIPGSVPNLLALPPGCAFQPRCERAADRCGQEAPRLEEHRPGHSAACHFALTAGAAV